MTNPTRVYLVEKVIDDHLEAIAILPEEEKEMAMIEARAGGLVTEVEIGTLYPHGMGCARHWYIGDVDGEDTCYTEEIPLDED